MEFHYGDEVRSDEFAWAVVLDERRFGWNTEKRSEKSSEEWGAYRAALPAAVFIRVVDQPGPRWYDGRKLRKI